MIPRLLHPTLSHSFFLFGPRGVGKTTLINSLLPPEQTFHLNLLDFEMESRLLRYPREFKEILAAQPDSVKWIFIDEIQRIPKLLDEIHRHIEEHPNRFFALTGSSARKLKRGHANLLAGRAFAYHLFPFTSHELGPQFDLDATLTYGSMPKILSFQEEDCKLFLRAYCKTYLQEEILQEGIIRSLAAFRQFLSIAATQNGHVLAWATMAQDVGVDSKTIRSYFEILEDTLIGFMLPAYHRSIRKRQKTHPKFYFFDCGVKRALANELTLPLADHGTEYGRAFEHWFIVELFRLNQYRRLDYQFSYLATNDVEIDLVIERPGKSTLLVEIKSTEHIQSRHVSALAGMVRDFPNSQGVCVSRDTIRRETNGILVCHYSEFLNEIMGDAAINEKIFPHRNPR